MTDCKPTRRADTGLIRYGIAVAGPTAATLITLGTPPLDHYPFHVFLAFCVATALYAGVGPAFFSTGLSVLIMSVIMVFRYSSPLFRPGTLPVEDVVHLVGFALVSLTVCSLAAAARREREIFRRGEESFRVWTEAASDGILVTDEDGKVVFMNTQAQCMFGYCASSLIGQHVTSFLGDTRSLATLQELRHRCDTRQRITRIETVGRHASGADVPMEMSLSVFIGPNSTGMIVIIREPQAEPIFVASHGSRPVLRDCGEVQEIQIAQCDPINRLVNSDSQRLGSSR